MDGRLPVDGAARPGPVRGDLPGGFKGYGHGGDTLAGGSGADGFVGHTGADSLALVSRCRKIDSAMAIAEMLDRLGLAEYNRNDRAGRLR